MRSSFRSRDYAKSVLTKVLRELRAAQDAGAGNTGELIEFAKTTEAMSENSKIQHLMSQVKVSETGYRLRGCKRLRLGLREMRLFQPKSPDRSSIWPHRSIVAAEYCKPKQLEVGGGQQLNSIAALDAPTVPW